VAQLVGTQAGTAVLNRKAAYAAAFLGLPLEPFGGLKDIRSEDELSVISRG
jgi:hypothetical protein